MKEKSQLQKEIDADINAINIYIKMGYSKKEAFDTFYKVFNVDKNPHILKKYNTIKNFIINHEAMTGTLLNTKSTPMLFSQPMVKAILAGHKTETRRKLTLQPIKIKGGLFFPLSKKLGLHGSGNSYSEQPNFSPEFIADFCRWTVGANIWVKETWTNNVDRKFPNAEESPNKDIYNFTYKADKIPHVAKLIKWKSGMFMPRSAARIFLSIASIRCERLQDITHEGAIAEGIRQFKTIIGFHYALNEDDDFRSRHAVDSYRLLWESINGPGSWGENPWVWVIKFKKQST